MWIEREIQVEGTISNVETDELSSVITLDTGIMFSCYKPRELVERNLKVGGRFKGSLTLTALKPPDNDNFYYELTFG